MHYEGVSGQLLFYDKLQRVMPLKTVARPFAIPLAVGFTLEPVKASGTD